MGDRGVREKIMAQKENQREVAVMVPMKRIGCCYTYTYDFQCEPGLRDWMYLTTAVEKAKF